MAVAVEQLQELRQRLADVARANHPDPPHGANGQFYSSGTASGKTLSAAERQQRVHVAEAKVGITRQCPGCSKMLNGPIVGKRLGFIPTPAEARHWSHGLGCPQCFLRDFWRMGGVADFYRRHGKSEEWIRQRAEAIAQTLHETTAEQAAPLPGQEQRTVLSLRERLAVMRAEIERLGGLGGRVPLFQLGADGKMHFAGSTPGAGHALHEPSAGHIPTTGKGQRISTGGGKAKTTGGKIGKSDLEKAKDLVTKLQDLTPGTPEYQKANRTYLRLLGKLGPEEYTAVHAQQEALRQKRQQAHDTAWHQEVASWLEDHKDSPEGQFAASFYRTMLAHATPGGFLHILDARRVIGRELGISPKEVDARIRDLWRGENLFHIDMESMHGADYTEQTRYPWFIMGGNRSYALDLHTGGAHDPLAQPISGQGTYEHFDQLQSRGRMSQKEYTTAPKPVTMKGTRTKSTATQQQIADDHPIRPAVHTRISQSAVLKAALRDPTRFQVRGNEDPFLHAIAEEQGFTGLPQLVTADQLDTFIAQGERELYRGMSQAKYTTALMRGMYFAGTGVSGNGIYTSSGPTRLNEARIYARGTGEVVRMSLKVGARVVQLETLVGRKQRLIRMAVDRAAKEMRALKTEAAQERVRRRLQVLMGVYGDPGRLAALLGYDAIDTESAGNAYHLVVLNRTALRIQETPVAFSAESRAAQMVQSILDPLVSHACAYLVNRIHEASYPILRNRQDWYAEIQWRDALVQRLIDVAYQVQSIHDPLWVTTIEHIMHALDTDNTLSEQKRSVHCLTQREAIATLGQRLQAMQAEILRAGARKTQEVHGAGGRIVGNVSLGQAAPKPTGSGRKATGATAVGPSKPAASLKPRDIPMDQIHVGLNPREEFDPAKLQELADSIKANGLIQPITVRPHQGGYQIIAGERRYRAMKLNGATHIPVIVRQVDDKTAHELALIENISRADMTLLETAKAYQALLDKGTTLAELKQLTGKSPAVLRQHLDLLTLEPHLQKLFNTGKLSQSLISDMAKLSLVGREEAASRILEKDMGSRLAKGLIQTIYNREHQLSMFANAAPTKAVIDAKGRYDALVQEITDRLHQLDDEQVKLMAQGVEAPTREAQRLDLIMKQLARMRKIMEMESHQRSLGQRMVITDLQGLRLGLAQYEEALAVGQPDAVRRTSRHRAPHSKKRAGKKHPKLRAPHLPSLKKRLGALALHIKGYHGHIVNNIALGRVALADTQRSLVWDESLHPRSHGKFIGGSGLVAQREALRTEQTMSSIRQKAQEYADKHGPAAGREYLRKVKYQDGRGTTHEGYDAIQRHHEALIQQARSGALGPEFFQDLPALRTLYALYQQRSVQANIPPTAVSRMRREMQVIEHYLRHRGLTPASSVATGRVGNKAAPAPRVRALPPAERQALTEAVDAGITRDAERAKGQSAHRSQQTFADGLAALRLRMAHLTRNFTYVDAHGDTHLVGQGAGGKWISNEIIEHASGNTYHHAPGTKAGGGGKREEYRPVFLPGTLGKFPGRAGRDPYGPPDVAFLHQMYGSLQLPHVLRQFPLALLKEAAIERGEPIPKGTFTSREKAIAYLVHSVQQEQGHVGPKTEEEFQAFTGKTLPKSSVTPEAPTPAEHPELPRLRERLAALRQELQASGLLAQHPAVDKGLAALEKTANQAGTGKAKRTPQQSVTDMIRERQALEVIRRIPEKHINPWQPLDPDFLRYIYGDHQLHAAMQSYSRDGLRESIRAYYPTDRRFASKQAMIEYLAQRAQEHSIEESGRRARVRDKDAYEGRDTRESYPERANSSTGTHAHSTDTGEGLLPRPAAQPGHRLDPFAAPQADKLHEIYGTAQLERALGLYKISRLRETADQIGLPKGGTREELAQRLAQYQIAKDGIKAAGDHPTAEEQRIYDAAVKAQTLGAKAAGTRIRPGDVDLKVLHPVEGAKFRADRPPDPRVLHQMYGTQQMPTALGRYKLNTLNASAREIGAPVGKTKAETIDNIIKQLLKMQGEIRATIPDISYLRLAPLATRLNAIHQRLFVAPVRRESVHLLPLMPISHTTNLQQRLQALRLQVPSVVRSWENVQYDDKLGNYLNQAPTPEAQLQELERILNNGYYWVHPVEDTTPAHP